MNPDESNRRNFLKMLLVLTFPSIRVEASDKNSDKYLSNLNKEFLMVYKQWVQQENFLPIDYFYSSMKSYGLGYDQVSKATIMDFDRGNFLIVNGLVLGKTEASIIAHLGAEL